MYYYGINVCGLFGKFLYRYEQKQADDHFGSKDIYLDKIIVQDLTLLLKINTKVIFALT